MSNLDTALQASGNNLQDIPIVTNMNTGFRGPRGLNRVRAVDVGKLDSWIYQLCFNRSNVISTRPLATFTLPGAHDAMTYAYKAGLAFWRRPFKGGTVTQKLDLVGQFNLGIRYFDIRVKGDKKGKLIGFHGGVSLTGDDAIRAIGALFIQAVKKKEPIVIKFDYKGKGLDIVLKIAKQFSNNLMSSSDYWRRGVKDCINNGRVLCLFHKVKDKHQATLDASDISDMIGDYSSHKAGGFSNKHNMKHHQQYLEKNLIAKSIAPHEEKLKVMSLNIPCIPTKPKQITASVFNGILLGIPGLIYKGGQVLAGTPRDQRWIGFYKSVKSIEQKSVVNNINIAFVTKLTEMINSWYWVAEENDSAYQIKNYAEQVTSHVAGVVGMDFVGDKRALIYSLIELNNRDF